MNNTMEEHIQIYLEYKTDQENWFDHIEAIQKNIKEIGFSKFALYILLYDIKYSESIIW